MAGRSSRAPLGVDVDVPVGQLHDPDLPAQVAAILAETGLPPELPHLALPESAVLGEVPGPADALVGLARVGVRLVVDGFGTGYSNLARLARLPVAELKIPPSVLADVPIPGGIVPAITSLAQAMGLTATAEGVENRAGRAAARPGLRHGRGPVVRGAGAGRGGRRVPGGARGSGGRPGRAALPSGAR